MCLKDFTAFEISCLFVWKQNVQNETLGHLRFLRWFGLVWFDVIYNVGCLYRIKLSYPKKKSYLGMLKKKKKRNGASSGAHYRVWVRGFLIVINLYVNY